jgi:hypothetical protein
MATVAPLLTKKPAFTAFVLAPQLVVMVAEELFLTLL